MLSNALAQDIDARNHRGASPSLLFSRAPTFFFNFFACPRSDNLASVRSQDAKGLPPDDSDALMKELSSLFKTMSERGNGAAIDRPFSSPYHWAGFQVNL